jgi:hypothetical protein
MVVNYACDTSLHFTSLHFTSRRIVISKNVVNVLLTLLNYIKFIIKFYSVKTVFINAKIKSQNIYALFIILKFISKRTEL